MNLASLLPIRTTQRNIFSQQINVRCDKQLCAPLQCTAMFPPPAAQWLHLVNVNESPTACSVHTHSLFDSSEETV